MTTTDAMFQVHEEPAGSSLLSRVERRRSGAQLTIALVAGGLLLLSVAMRVASPSQGDAAELVAGGAAALDHNPRASGPHGGASITPIFTV